MGSSFRMKSAHQADVKGKGILYDDDDDVPIKLVDRDDSYLIKEFGLSLIGKILNHRKQSVEKLLQTMPAQWGLADKITANDLGNGKFLLNFTTEEDLNFVLQQGPFHYNFCMFVLVRWEPIVHDDYPWIIPFWVHLIGFPLHLWTDTNLRNIGGRIGHIDTLELTEGRMLIEVDSRWPLKFSRKVEYEGDEVTIEIKYDKLFKHCSICGMMSHEKGYCPSLDIRTRIQPSLERSGVFSRVQLPQEQMLHLQSSQQSSRQSLLMGRDRYASSQATRHVLRTNSSGSNYESRGSQYRAREDIDHRGHHSDRVMRRRNEYKQRNRDGGTRYGPYERRTEQAWRVKIRKAEASDAVQTRPEHAETSQEIVPYEHVSALSTVDNNAGGSSRKLASTIVTPVRERHMVENVTLQDRGDARSLTFSPLREAEPSGAKDQIIEALHDMELMDQQDGGMPDTDDNEDDLLGLDLMEMEATGDREEAPDGMGRPSDPS
ncbi:hypothetical protein HID58_060262 [Brassica napus]|uniref:DUF4283 domain-containing protein n=1 Tax=Brassica napus TaxID=3708 RepID=A0ABQ7ZW28_BRANA|nr:hypothetical protein HID58_060262 [Brassica napus]